MGYSYGFHLVLVKPPKEVALDAVIFVEGDQKEESPIETYAKQVVAFCKGCHDGQDFQNHEFYFPRFAVEEYGGSRSYGCGDQNNGCIKTMAIIGKQFPDAIFALHHYYDDMTQLTVYTFQGDKILSENETDFQNFMVGPYSVCLRLNFLEVSMKGNISMFFNEEYGYDFDFSYEEIYACAEVPIPPKPNPYAGPQPLINIIQSNVGEAFVSPVPLMGRDFLEIGKINFDTNYQ